MRAQWALPAWTARTSNEAARTFGGLPHVRRSLVSLLSLALVVTACGRSLTEDQITKLVDQRLEQRGLGPPPETTASLQPEGGPAPENAASCSLELLARLDDLMRDWAPDLPTEADSADAMRCLTKQRLATDPEFQKLKAEVSRKAEGSKRLRAEREKEFRTRLLPLGYRYDLDWQTRKTAEVAATYGCFNSAMPNQGGYGPGGNGFYPGWAPLLDTEERCRSYGREFEWVVRSPAKPAVFTYSNSATAPDAPPELMRRMTSARISLPPRFSCKVADVVPRPGGSTIMCDPSETGPQLRMSGDSIPVNIGDLVSVPLADTRRDPEGVLSRAARPRETGPRAAGRGKGRGAAPQPTREHPDTYFWVVDADWAKVTVDIAATCPSPDEIRTAIGKGNP